jgi:predicted GNAT family acetyltransferase
VILPPGAEELQSGFRELDWEADHFLFMVYRGGGEPAETGHVEEVAPERLHRLREEIVREWQTDADPATVEEIIAADTLMWKAANSRIFGIVEDGEVVSSAQLYSAGRSAQVEEVATLPSHRGRGHAKAVVTKAVEEALAGDHDFLFLVADGDAWPKALYTRLGFEEVGSRFAFQRR